MLAYVDESGHPHPKDPTQRPVLIAVCISEIDVRRLDALLHALKRDHLGWDDTKELKGAKLLARRKLARNPDWLVFAETLVECIVAFPLEIVGVVMDRPSAPPPADDRYLPLPHRDLIERIHAAVRNQTTDSATILFDGTNRSLARAYAQYLYRSSAGQQLIAITDAPYFVDSAITPGIQIADVVAYMIRVYEERDFRHATLTQLVSDEDRFIKRAWERIRTKVPRDLKTWDGRSLHGIRRRTASQLDEDTRRHQPA